DHHPGHGPPRPHRRPLPPLPRPPRLSVRRPVQREGSADRDVSPGPLGRPQRHLPGCSV
ncbi:MAG: hypothetical protein AVDCRST_MAG68-5138, partial [uncultured Gemmatimonadetes bacterium]